MGLVSRAASASSSSPPTTTVASGLTKMMEAPAELAAVESTVASWPLMRGVEWEEVKRRIGEGVRSSKKTFSKSE